MAAEPRRQVLDEFEAGGRLPLFDALNELFYLLTGMVMLFLVPPGRVVSRRTHEAFLMGKVFSQMSGQALGKALHLRGWTPVGQGHLQI